VRIEPPRDKNWWSQSGSNRRPPACKAGALPAELWPHGYYQDFCVRLGADPRSWLKPMSGFATTSSAEVVGLGGLEPPTSPLSGVRSNHLSYRPGRDRLLFSSSDLRQTTKNPLLPVSMHVRAWRPRRSGSLSLDCTGVLCGRLAESCHFSKGGDPAAPSDTATLLRLHPSHRPHRGKRPPCG
jgi:hypothetical protein